MRFLAPNIWIFIEPSVIWEFSENDGGLNNNSTSKSPLYGTIYGDIGALGLKIRLHFWKSVRARKKKPIFGHQWPSWGLRQFLKDNDVLVSLTENKKLVQPISLVCIFVLNHHIYSSWNSTDRPITDHKNSFFQNCHVTKVIIQLFLLPALADLSWSKYKLYTDQVSMEYGPVSREPEVQDFLAYLDSFRKVDHWTVSFSWSLSFCGS